MDKKLRDSFRWHLQNMPRFRHGFGEGLDTASRTQFAIAMARRDVAAGITRHPAPVKPYPAAGAADGAICYVDNPEACGMRFIGRVSPEFRRGPFDSRESDGWPTDPEGYAYKDGAGLCWGEVWQLAGRNGKARFVAGYRYGGCDGGPALDLRHVYMVTGEEVYWVSRGDKSDIAELRSAAYAADSMAQRAAEEEREYQTAWRAGSDYAVEGETIAAARAELLEILKERREVKGTMAYPALCRAIRSTVESLLEKIGDARDARRKLREGDYYRMIFWPGDKRLAAAFNEGAGETVLPT